MSEDLIHKELSGQILHACMTVLNALKPGLDEAVYERALALELDAQGHRVDQQMRHPIYSRQTKVGELIPDLIVDESIIVDTKVVAAFNEHHVAQMLGYLSITGLELALLVNFNYAKLGWKRVVLTNPSAPSALSAVQSEGYRNG